MTQWRTRLLLAAVLALIWLAPDRAEAKGFFLLTYGSSFKHVGEVPAEHKEAIRRATNEDPAIGYRYSYFGPFWVDLWTRSGE